MIGKKDKAPNPKVRVAIVVVFFALLFGAILARSFQLQAIDGAELRKKAERQHKTTVNVSSRRGEIYDRNRLELAVSLEADSVYAEPRNIEATAQNARALAKTLGVNRKEMEKKLDSDSGFAWIVRQTELTSAQREMLANLDGVGITKEPRRYYPNNSLAANVIGFTGTDSNGLEGIELNYDSYLKGQVKSFSGEKDATGRVIMSVSDSAPPERGLSVELTIDKNVQYLAEKALKKAVDDSGAKGGTAIVMEPQSGEILAMANLPGYDPNNFGAFSSRDWKNRAVADMFEPGSVMKAFVIAAALEENITRKNDLYYCEMGSYRVSDRVFHDVEKNGWLSVGQILKYSSNICTAKIGERLGKERLYRYLKSFGFGERTGVDLPGEASGSLRHYKYWSPVTLHTVSFGQGVSSSAMQLINAFSAIANGGYLMRPYIVKTIRDAKGDVVAANTPMIVRRVISEDTADKLTEMLIGVTQSGGTGVKAALADFMVAGKTATAQKPDFKSGGYQQGAYVSSFFGFVPARNPRLVVLVIIDEPQGDYYGGSVAAPAFAEIASESLSYMGVFKGNGGGNARLKFVSAASYDDNTQGGLMKKAATYRPSSVPDFTGKSIRAALREAKLKSVELAVAGSGRAVDQRPAPGSAIPDRGPVYVKFE